MKLSKLAHSVLKNFNSINQGIVIRSGEPLRTVAISKEVMGQATLEDEFPVDFAIYDLSEFLSTVSLFDDPDLEFKDEYMTIGEGKTKVLYYYSSEAAVIQPEDHDFEEGDINFTLTERDITSLTKAAAIMKLDNINIRSSGNGVIEFALTDSENSTDNQFFIEIDAECDSFSVDMQVENLKFIPDDYSVNINPDADGVGIAKLTNSDKSLTYWVAVL